MATFIKSDPSNGTTGTLPTNAGEMIRTAQWGIDNTLDGWIIQSESITSEAITDTTQDQKGAVVSQLDYDEHFTLTLNMIGGTGGSSDGIGGSGDGTAETALPQVGDTTFSYAGNNWKVTSVTYNGSYQDKKSYTVTAERWHNFPEQS